MSSSRYRSAYLFAAICATLFMASCQSKQAHSSIDLDLGQTSDSVSLFAPGIVSTELYERDLAISPEKDEIIWTLGDYKQSIRCLVHLTQDESGTWSQPQILPFSGVYQDIEPFISPDGNKLFFASNRPLDKHSESDDYNIWVCEKLPSGWGNPIPLPVGINTPQQEFYPAVAANGNLYFTATQEEGIGREDIYVSRVENGEYQVAVPLDTTVNTAAYEFNAWVSPDENILIFSSFGRSDDLGGGDLYMSRKAENGIWQSAVHLNEPINSPKLDYCPFVEVENGIFYFSSERVGEKPDMIRSIDELSAHADQILNGMSNIYRMNFAELEK